MATPYRQAAVLDLDQFSYIPPSWGERRKKEHEKKLDELFVIFERDGNGTCDVREVGAIVRAMGLNPSEAQVNKIIETVEEVESTGFIKLDRLRTVILDILITHEFKGQLMIRDEEETIFRAFAALDKDRKGYVESEYLKEVLTTMGEKLNTEEVLEMINAAADPETGHIYYDEYAPVLSTE
jgi:calmodulin